MTDPASLSGHLAANLRYVRDRRGLTQGQIAKLCGLPRSTVANIETGGRRGFENEAQRLLGRVRTELEYRNVAEIAEDLPGSMERLQRACAQATEVVTRRYFAGAEALYWHGIQG